MTRHFSISYSRPMRLLARVLLIGPNRSGVAIDTDTVRVWMGWGFRATLRRDTVHATRLDRRVISRGVHGWRGRWLVNGAADGLVRLTIEPRQRGWTAGIPLSLREVTVSVEDPEGLLAAL
ncbi:MAG: hypothetical protein ACK5OX_01285 [Desertimonas sp.]